jgi:hypothetical protein
MIAASAGLAAVDAFFPRGNGVDFLLEIPGEPLGSAQPGAEDGNDLNCGRYCDWSPGALGLTRLLSSLLFGASPRDPWTLLLVSGVLATVAAAACYIPAHRAAGVDPLVALGHE